MGDPNHPCFLVINNRRFVRLATGDEEKIREGRTSYPSGHAAETTMTFGLLTFYLLARLRLFTRQSQVHGMPLVVVNVGYGVVCLSVGGADVCITKGGWACWV
jgi:membrane-associated phospholipid phosphatase